MTRLTLIRRGEVQVLLMAFGTLYFPLKGERKKRGQYARGQTLCYLETTKRREPHQEHWETSKMEIQTREIPLLEIASGTCWGSGD